MSEMLDATAAREEARLETIGELGLLDTASDASFDRIVRLLRLFYRVPIAAFTIIDSKRVFFKASEGLSSRQMPRALSVCPTTAESEHGVFILDAETDPDYRQHPLVTSAMHVRFYAALPVRAPNGIAVGSLCILDHESRDFPTEQRQTLLDLRDALEEVLLLRAESLTDGLTGLFNRRHLTKLLGNEWHRAYRHLVPFSVLMCDVDHFKAFNDTYGHVEGDRCLQAVAGVLKEQVKRSNDLVARYGGEEFVLLLPQTDASGTRRVAEKIRAAVTALRIPHSSEPGGVVTISIGGAVALSKEDLELGEMALIDLADKALYEAKAAGRNRVVVRSILPA